MRRRIHGSGSVGYGTDIAGADRETRCDPAPRGTRASPARAGDVSDLPAMRAGFPRDRVGADVQRPVHDVRAQFPGAVVLEALEVERAQGASPRPQATRALRPNGPLIPVVPQRSRYCRPSSPKVLHLTAAAAIAAALKTHVRPGRRLVVIFCLIHQSWHVATERITQS